MLNRQMVFDDIARHAKRQRQRAISGLYCAYRSGDGGKCFIGVLIPDDRYTPGMEGRSIQTNIAAQDAIDPKYGLVRDDPYWHDDRLFLSTVQGVHDNHDPTEWPHYLVKLAANYALSPAAVLEAA